MGETPEWQDISTGPTNGEHVLVRFEGTMTPPTVAHWFGPPPLPGLRAGGWYLSVQQMEGPQIHPTHWRHVPPFERPSVEAGLATVTEHRYIDGKDFAKTGPHLTQNPRT